MRREAATDPGFRIEHTVVRNRAHRFERCSLRCRRICLFDLPLPCMLQFRSMAKEYPRAGVKRTGSRAHVAQKAFVNHGCRRKGCVWRARDGGARRVDHLSSQCVGRRTAPNFGGQCTALIVLTIYKFVLELLGDFRQLGETALDDFSWT